MIADTSFLIDLIKQEPAAVRKAEEVEAGDALLIPAPALFELHSGLARSKYPEKERQAMLAALDGQEIAVLDEEGAAFAGEMHGSSVQKGTSAGVVDCLIAGIAKAKHERVLTRNVKAFRKLGVLVETY